MPLPSRLAVSRHGVYYFRISIPTALRQHFGGQAELRQSLGTRDPREAKAMAYQLSFSFLSAFGKLPMSKKKDFAADIIARQQAAIDSLAAIGGVGKIRIDADGSVECDTIEEYQAVQAMRAGGGAMPKFDAGPALRGELATTRQRTASGVSFLGLMEAALRERIGTWVPRTAKDYRSKCEAFAAFVGDKPIAAIGREDVNNFKRKLLDEGIAPKTVNKYLGALAVVFDHARKNEHFEGRLPTEEQHMPVKKDDVPREPFTSNRLRQIFDPARMGALTDPADFWFPLLAVFTGMRISEIGQLYADDIVNVDGVDAISVNTKAVDKRVKRAASRREIPMPKQLVDLGFLAYVDTVNAAGATRLFPHLNLTEQGYGKEIGKRFERYLDSIGAKAEKVSFHSFRHTFNGRLSKADEAKRCAFVGQKYESTNIRYDAKPTFDDLVSEILPRIHFAEVNVAALRCPPTRFAVFLRAAVAKRENAAVRAAGPAAAPAAKTRGRGRGRPTR